MWLIILGGELENETSQHFCGIILNSANSLEIHQMAQENTVWTKLETLVEIIHQGWWETRLTRTEVCFRLSLKALVEGRQVRRKESIFQREEIKQ